ncbi:hypothetical protein AWENTII_010029 [Aspergillus wentii]
MKSSEVNSLVTTDKSNSIFLNLADCQVKWSLPPGSGTRKRVARDKFRQLIIDDLDLDGRIMWGKAMMEPNRYGAPPVERSVV